MRRAATRLCRREQQPWRAAGVVMQQSRRLHRLREPPIDWCCAALFNRAQHGDEASRTLSGMVAPIARR
jgi:hypothetical protein